jgi:Ornithine cyclodeaminase/mu-crystallin family
MVTYTVIPFLNGCRAGRRFILSAISAPGPEGPKETAEILQPKCGREYGRTQSPIPQAQHDERRDRPIEQGNAARNMAALTSVDMLFDSGTGRQLATIAGDVLTARRTAAATSALAASYLSREDATSLLVLGSGRIASLLPEAYRTVRNIHRIGVWNVNADSAARMVDRL